MSKRNGKNKMKLALLNEINHVDKRLKRFKNNEEETSKLMTRRNTLRSKLKTK
tara:strand:- start:257 stop:415 length:159 start_codon:yes stop_codon:yes gene_type:complete